MNKTLKNILITIGIILLFSILFALYNAYHFATDEVREGDFTVDYSQMILLK